MTPPDNPGSYRVILADPPWAFVTHNGQRRTPTQKKFVESVDPQSGKPDAVGDHYPTMSHAEMAALPVGEWADKDCLLFMWVVGSHLDEAIALARAWGFTFVTDAFYWIKQKLIDADQIDLFTGDIAEPVISMGYYSRKQTEPVWLFKRGRCPVKSKSVRQLIIEPRREHSRKPDAIYDRIEALADGPYLELFSRTTRQGWDAWGNEVGKFGGGVEVAA